MNNIKVENVIRTYNGRSGCMCGCLGTYSTTAAAVKREQEAQPDYLSLEHVDVRERSVKIAVNKINKAIDKKDPSLLVGECPGGELYYGIDNGIRNTTVYLFAETVV